MTADLATLARKHWLNNYRLDIRAGVRGLWKGVFTYHQAWEQFRMSIESGLRLAWQDGGMECGIKPAEWTPQEKQALRNAIVDELSRVDRFLTAIEENSKANGGKLGPLLSRADTWTNRYVDVRNRAMSMMCQNKKLIWRLGATQEHCRDCLKYEGRVYRGKTWEKWGAMPQSRSLECGGYRCKCKLELTDKRCTPGRPPKPTHA